MSEMPTPLVPSNRGRRVLTAVWEARRQEVERLVRGGMSPTNAAREASGYVCNMHFARYYPEWWQSMFRLYGETQIEQRPTTSRALELRREGEARWRAAHQGPDARTFAMYTLLGSGWRLEEIGALFGVSRQRAHQIISTFTERSEAPSSRARRVRQHHLRQREGS